MHDRLLRLGVDAWTTWRALCVALTLVALPACSFFFDAEVPEYEGDLADASADGGTGDASLDGGDDAGADVAADVDPGDIGPDGSDADVADGGELACGDQNCCGGEAPLEFDGAAALPGADCPPCGVLICDGSDALTCVQAAVTGPCGDCTPAPGASGDACGPCADGTSLCDGDTGALLCDAASDLNACGACGELAAQPGELCEAADGLGVVRCTGTGMTQCLPAGTNECGGELPLAETIGAPCGVCDQGRVACDGLEGTTCAGFALGVNACGSCGPLAAEPGDSCGSCGTGEWVCDPDDPLRVICSDPGRNECGGCSDLGGALGDACDGGALVCSGLDALVCAESSANVCGGTSTLEGGPGDACGECNDGLLVCAGPDALVCLGGSEANVCGTCGVLPGATGEACARNSIWACPAGEGQMRCVELEGTNECGGSVPLVGALGDPCGLCASGALVCEGTDALTCAGEDADAESLWFEDRDRDRFGDDDVSVRDCERPEGFVDQGGDCAPDDRTTYPGAPELCDLTSNDCDTEIDEGVVDLLFYPDADVDGFGDASADPIVSCTAPEGYVSNATDCDDRLSSVNPDAVEICDGEDQNCDGVRDEGVVNACGGCVALSEPVGAPCGPCNLDALVCDGQNALSCDGSTDCPDDRVTTFRPDPIGESSATLRGDLVVVTGVTEIGFCYGTERQPSFDGDASCVADPAEPVRRGPFDAAVSELEAVTRYFVRSYARLGPNTVFGNEEVFVTGGIEAPNPPTMVVASDGTRTDVVEVSWSASPGAADYDVYRDGSFVGTTDALRFEDGGASASPVPAPPLTFNLEGSVFGVALTWSAATVPPAERHTYTVVASNVAGESAPSAPDSGFRDVEPIQGYEVRVDGTWIEVGLLAEYQDTEIAAVEVTPGATSASDGTSADFVALAVEPELAAETRTYEVRAFNASGDGGAAGPLSGERTPGEFTYVWERSEGDEDANFTEIARSASNTFEDRGAPVDGEGRYYRVRIETEDARTFQATSDRGFRNASLPSIATEDVVYAAGESVTLRGRLDSLGTPAASDHGFCASENTAPSLEDDDSTFCTSLGAPAGTGDFGTTVDEIPLGVTLFVRAYALSEAGVAYGGSVSFLTTPALTEVVRATDGDIAGAVEVDWDEVDGATEYIVRRDGDVIAVVAAPPYRDNEANAPPAPTAIGFALGATQGTESDAVVVTWAEPETRDGGSHNYDVVARNAAGASPGVVADEGFAGAYPILRYEVRRGLTAWIDVGDTLEFIDTTADEGSVATGTIAASDTTSVDHVTLEAPGIETQIGNERNYFVRAISAGGNGDTSASVSGWRGPPEFALQWERSAAASDGAYSDIPGGTSAPFDDAGAPEDGSTRFFRLRLDVAGEPPMYSNADRGNRAAAPIATTDTVNLNNPDSPFLIGEFERFGVPRATGLGFCFAFAPEDPRDEGAQEGCVALNPPFFEGTYGTGMPDVEYLTDYRFVAYAESELGRFYSSVVVDFTSRNPCGGTGGEVFELGDDCGTCSFDVYVCDDNDNVVCDGDTFFEGYPDGDGDTFGDAFSELLVSCDPDEYVINNLDCDDTTDAINPDQDDTPDDAGEDTNCDGVDGDVERSVFVSNEGSAAGNGSLDRPFDTIEDAMEAMNLDEGVSTILVAEGVYNERVDLLDGVSMYAGYDPDTWSRDADVSLIRSPTSIAIYVDGYEGVGEVVDFEFASAAGGDATGVSSRALVALDVSGSLTFRNCNFAPFDGADGVVGADGVDGVDGGIGGDGGETCFVGGCGAQDGEGGTPGSSACGAEGGEGADGGVGGLSHTTGRQGAPGSGGASGGERSERESGNCGSTRYSGAGPGDPGAHGTDGASANASFSSDPLPDGDDDWVAATGPSGFDGTDGESGGGGGSGAGHRANTSITNLCSASTGGGGGGGGGGGCGGTAGLGGTGGGASIGVFATRSDGLVIEDCFIATANGGDGGAGGAGGEGGLRGLGGDGGRRTNGGHDGGGDGGDGGAGGDGGGGAGGAGGMSVGVFLYDSYGATLRDNDIRTGFGGEGGAGGAGGLDVGSAGPGGEEHNVFFAELPPVFLVAFAPGGAGATRVTVNVLSLGEPEIDALGLCWDDDASAIDEADEIRGFARCQELVDPTIGGGAIEIPATSGQTLTVYYRWQDAYRIFSTQVIP